MALNKILSSMVEDFCEKNTFRDLPPSKAYEYMDAKPVMKFIYKGRTQKTF